MTGPQTTVALILACQIAAAGGMFAYVLRHTDRLRSLRNRQMLLASAVWAASATSPLVEVAALIQGGFFR